MELKNDSVKHLLIILLLKDHYLKMIHLINYVILVCHLDMLR